jgi:hypothetical protein
MSTLRIRAEDDPIGRLAVIRRRMCPAGPGGQCCPGRAGWEGKALLQKLIGVVITVLVLVWVISNPVSAGNAVHDWIAGIITFFEHLS